MINPSKVGLLSCLFYILFHFSNAQSQLRMTLPRLKNGLPSVGVRTMSFTDETRLDDFAPIPQPREVLVSLFYPAGKHFSDLNDPQPEKTRYVLNATAELYDREFSPFGTRPGVVQHIYSHSQVNATLYTSGGRPLPLLVFSPGYNMTFRFYSAILEEIARKGYIVAAIDHPYDAAIVEFPNGKVVYGADGLDWSQALATRVQDITFVLNELSHTALSHPFPISTNQVVAFGHSLGGDAAVEVMLNDRRVAGGINFDGGFYGSFASSKRNIFRPVVLFRNEANPPVNNWDNAWWRLAGWKVELRLDGSTSYSFSDLPLLADALGIRRAIGLGLLGPINIGWLSGIRVLDLMSAYVTAFAEFVDDAEGNLYYRLPNSYFPEVKRIR